MRYEKKQTVWLLSVSSAPIPQRDPFRWECEREEI